MIVSLPESARDLGLSEAELRVELACSLFAQGKVSSRPGAELAGLAYEEFLDALRVRRIPRSTPEMLREDVATLNELFPDRPMGRLRD